MQAAKTAVSLSRDNLNGGMARLEKCIVPRELESDWKNAANTDIILFGELSDAIAECRKTIADIFGNNIPLFAAYVLSELQDCHSTAIALQEKSDLETAYPELFENKEFLNFLTRGEQNKNDTARAEAWLERNNRTLVPKILLMRFITVAKILMLFGMKILSEKPVSPDENSKDNLWIRSGLKRVHDFTNPNNPHAIYARRRYIATMMEEIFRNAPTRNEKDEAQKKLHKNGWKLSNIYNSGVMPNCVVNGMRMMTGIAQAVGWNKVLMCNVMEDSLGDPTRHIDTLIGDPGNPLAWEYVDSFHSRGPIPATGLVIGPDMEKMMSSIENPAPESVMTHELTKGISICTGLPLKMMTTDPLTGLCAVNLHHASIPTEGEEIKNVHEILSLAGHAISPVLSAYWA